MKIKSNHQIVALTISAILIIITFNLFNIIFILNFKTSDLTNIIVNNQIYDEVSSYLIRTQIINLHHKFSFSIIQDNFFFLKDTFSTIQNYLIFSIFGYEKLYLYKNTFLLFGNIILYYVLFSKLFKFSKIFSLSSSFLIIINFAYTPFNYNYLFEFINLKSTQLMTLARTESPGNSNIAFLLSLILFFYYTNTKKYIFLFFSLFIGFFSYFYTTLILITFYNLYVVKIIYERKKYINKNLIDLCIINILFILWVILILTINKNNFYIYSITEIRNDLKTFLICFFFIFLNFTNIKYLAKDESKKISFVLIIFQISFLICYYSSIITKVSLGGVDRFYYFSNQSYWFTILNIIYFNSKKFNKIFPFLILILSIIIFYCQKNYVNQIFIQEGNKIKNQMNYREDFYKTNFHKYKNYIAIDILFFNHYNYYLKEDQVIKNYISSNNTPYEQLHSFVKICKKLQLNFSTCEKILFMKSNYSNKNLSLNNLLFYNYYELHNNKENFNKIFKKLYLNSDNNLDVKYIIINKNDFIFAAEYINSQGNLFQVIEENRTFIIYKINY